ncbi:hypothetical protein SAMN06269185_0654 [Natronoarchaeum philippinense]|uniref:Uncharacterized protein n=1 Tax=Natronoarchaeum philippinense TaxID=558529 RepID=A0A285N9U1_NATPI|nr:hypothetical protein [Natronoarchaeum philippinense]SNZ04716.1 hypothetical protein SAMN06269185_0654 [Natronoarchaeum philippinense]
MPEIEITDAQREYLERLRSDLAEDVEYGHVRPRDALQFLIDAREGEDAIADATAAADSADATESGDADEEDADSEETADDDEASDADVDTEVADDEAESDDEAVTEDAEDEPKEAPAPTPGGGDRLNAMMQLLDTHDDKWREGSGDARYEVDLPDGSTETANTKDDVRALLFKNY